LSELAEEATVYEQARSPGTWSLPSHTSIFTGYHVVEHGITRARHKLEPGHTIFEELQEQGYSTGVFSENTWITDMDCGLRDVFDTVEGARNLLFPDAIDPSNFVLSEGQGQYTQFLRRCLTRDDTLQSLANGAFTKLAWDYPRLLPDRFTSSTPAEVYGDLFLDWEAEQSKPWAATINFMDGHLPYLPDDEHDKWGGSDLRSLQDEMDDQVWEFNGSHRPWWQRKALEGLYDGAIHQMDAQIERVIEVLRNRGVLDDTLVIVTSDHGEGFGEPSRIRGDRDSPRPNARVAAHGAGIHEVLCHVPLIVRPPSGGDGDRINEPATLTEFPTMVKETLGGNGGSFIPDQPVVVSSHGLEEPMEERASRYAGDLYRFNGDCRAVYEANAETIRKYLSWRDKRGRVDLVGASASWLASESDNGVVDKRFASVSDRSVQMESDAEIDKSTQNRLEDLGYM
jgi:arylsulfatase A-like enzyme